MSVNIPKINYPVGSPNIWMGTMYYNYRYDQLNRITGMNAHTGFLNNGVWPAYMLALNDYRERVSYDANGNILKYLRNGTTIGGKPLGMDSLTYKYYSGTNQLRQVRDTVNAANYTEDIDNQSDASNYVYDEIGNLIQDKAEGIDSIKWNVYGKISNIYKSSGLKIGYTYDAGGNRISKKVINGADTTVTWYVRDATGNVMSVYTEKNDTLVQDEIHLYGSTRIGILKPGRILTLDEQYGETIDTLDLSLGIAKGSVFRRGQKFFELANHLGNVLVTISDKKFGLDTNGDSTVNYYMADVMTANDYYPFGMAMPGKRFTATNAYRYGFNGKENDNEVKGEGNQQDYGMRIYDPRAGRFLSVDPLQAQYPELTPYQFASNSAIANIDLDGLERYYYKLAIDSKTGTTALTHSATDEREGTLIDALFGRKPSGKKITTKNIYVNVEVNGSYNQTLHFNWFKEVQDWQAKGMPVDQAEGEQQRAKSKAMADAAVVQLQMMTVSQQIDMADGDIDGYAAPGSQPRPTSATNKQATAANGGNPKAAESNTAGITLKIKTAPQPGKGFTYKSNNTTISDGKINITGQKITTGRYDFVITSDGKLLIGRGHHTLSGGATTVKAAGEMKIVNGQVREVTNSSGHYKPTIEQGQSAVEQLKGMGVNTSGARVTLYNADGSTNKTYINR